MTEPLASSSSSASLRADSLNRRIAEALRDQAPEGVVVEIADDLHALPFYNEDIDTDQVPAAAAASCARWSPRRTAYSPSRRSTTAPCRPCSTTPSTGSRAPTAPARSPASASVSSAPPPRRTAASGRTRTPALRHHRGRRGRRRGAGLAVRDRGGRAQRPPDVSRFAEALRSLTAQPEPARLAGTVGAMADLHDLTALEQGDLVRTPRGVVRSS